MKVLMIGPGRRLKGGISSVVESYYNVGLDKIVNLEYLDTFTEGTSIKKIKFAIKALFEFDNLAKKSDIIHIHMSSRGSFYRKSLFIKRAYRMKKKIILHVHGSEFEKFYEECNFLMQNYVRDIFSKCNKVIALSEEWKIILSNIVDANKIEVLYNSIEVRKNNLEKDYSKKKVLFLGRVGKRKGAYDILEVAPKIISKHPDVEFIIAGDGEVDRFRELCNKKNINKGMNIVGWIDGEEKIKLLDEATIYLLPSYNEGMPISILEAMSYRLPIISTNIGGIPQLITNEIEGYLINAGDIENLERLINQLLSNSELRKRLGNNSFHKVNEKFNLEKNIYRLYDIYKEC